MQNPYTPPESQVGDLNANAALDIGLGDRGTFINKTYTHLGMAVLAFILIEVALFKSGLALPITQFMLSISWLAVLGAFMIVAWMGSHFVHRAESKIAQYAALGAFVFAEAIIFVPMLVIAYAMSPDIIKNAAFITMGAFAALTAVVFVTRKDFSFLRSFLIWGGVCALGLIVCGALMGFDLGIYFTIGMIGFAGASILYDTSKILHHYPDDRYVAAALELFASLALMFWYVLRLLMRR